MRLGTRKNTLPARLSPEARKWIEALQAGGSVVLENGEGSRDSMPADLRDLLGWVSDSLIEDHAVWLVAEDDLLTTQQAADFLGISRPYLIRLLEAGKVPFRRVNSHRRIRMADIAAFGERWQSERVTGAAAITRLLDESGVYDRQPLGPE